MTGTSIKHAESVNTQESFKNSGHQGCPELSIIVPIYNEMEVLPDLLSHLQQWKRHGCEIVLVDGGSEDGCGDVAQAIGFTVFHSGRGRALQMNTGAAQASGAALVFLHADTRLPDNGPKIILKALKLKSWGRFNVLIEGNHFMLSIVSLFMNLRSCITGISTGDQAIFVRKALFEEIGGFPEQPLMEDIEISKLLKRQGRPACINEKVTTSGRRWLTRGVWRTIWLMWRLRFSYWRGMPADQIARAYL